MKPWLRFGLAFSIVGAVGACGSDSTGPEFGDTFTEGNALYFGESIFSNAEAGMHQLHWGTPNIELLGAPALPGVGRAHLGARSRPSRFPQPVAGAPMATYLSQLQAVAPGCNVSGYGSNGDPFNFYDGNGNGVPDDWYLKAVCNSEEDIGEGVTVAYHDELEIRMKERSGILWGWDASITQSYSDKRSDGVDHDAGYNEWHESLAVEARRAEYTLKGKEGGNGLDGDVPYFGEDGIDMKLVFVSYDDDIGLESLFPPGQAGLAGRIWTYDTDNPGWDWHISTPEALVWSPECADATNDPWVEGVVRVLLGGNAEKGFELSTLGCNTGWDINIFGDDASAATTSMMPRRTPTFSYRR